MIDRDNDLYDLERMLQWSYHGILPWENPMFHPSMDAMKRKIEDFMHRCPIKIETSDMIAGCEAWLRTHDKWKSLCAADPK